MKDPLESSELLAFIKTVDAKSLSSASRELGVPRATISRRLARLEERLGVRLLRRTTRALALTDVGTAFYRQAHLALDAIERAEASVARSDSKIRGALRVSTPPMADPPFLDLLCDYAERYPEVDLQVHSSTEHVDLHRDGYDVAIRASAILQPGLVARTLSRSTLIAVAAPKYLERCGVVRNPGDLRKHRCLVGFARGMVPESRWPLERGRNVHIDAAFSANHILLLRQAALRGLGIALLPWFIVRPDIERGQLVHVLPGVVHAESSISVVYAEREYLPPQVRAFIDLLVEAAPRLFPAAEHPPTPKRARKARR